jgi:uncharacterized protein DUF1592/uncharacterized protein DUF1588/uncharacterized protein DUF1595/uncharacterized protein DUF1585/uncharacterized protein DUF1587
MLNSPVSWRHVAVCLPALFVAAAGCQGSIGANGASGQGGGSVTGAAGVTGSGTAGSISTGVAGGGGGGVAIDPIAMSCMASNGALNAGLTPARRLTRDQFNNTVRDLLGATGTPADRLAPDEKIGPFNSNAIAPVDSTLVQQHQEVAATLATAAKARMAQIAPCDLNSDTGTSTTCATRFVTEFGRRAFRRPLDASEVQAYLSLYTLGKTGADAANGFRLVVEAMLQSPFFLYHHDVGAAGTPQAGTIAITPYELASRLSFFIWNSMPDDTLFARAADGTIATDSILTSEVQRMLASDKAAAAIALFHRQWLDVTDLPDQTKDATVYPRYNAQLGDAMMQELAMFTDHVVRKGDGLLKTLLTSNVGFPQGGLFSIYGVSQPSGYTVGTPITLDPTQRAGILTQAAFLTRWAHGNQTSPVHRGKLVRLNVMCGFIQPPPANVNTTPPAPTAATSTRERFAQHQADPQCSSCHVLMDPIGLGFETFDGIGAFRTMDGLGAVDATGSIVNGGDLDGAFNGPIELSRKLSESQAVSNCMVNQWFRYSLGRMETTNDACSIQGVREAFRASGGNIREMLARIALSPSFRNVRTGS